MMIDTSLSDWLLDCDPALRWQVERDLLDVDDDTWQETRKRVPAEGFGRELLSRGRPPPGHSTSFVNGEFLPRRWREPRHS